MSIRKNFNGAFCFSSNARRPKSPINFVSLVLIIFEVLRQTERQGKLASWSFDRKWKLQLTNGCRALGKGQKIVKPLFRVLIGKWHFCFSSAFPTENTRQGLSPVEKLKIPKSYRGKVRIFCAPMGTNWTCLREEVCSKFCGSSWVKPVVNTPLFRTFAVSLLFTFGSSQVDFDFSTRNFLLLFIVFLCT